MQLESPQDIKPLRPTPPVNLAMKLSVQLLGPAAILDAEKPLDYPRGKTSALLYYLAYQNDWVSREDVLYLFWPDSDEFKARQSLRQVLNSIRKLPFMDALETRADSLLWQVATDVEAFKTAIKAEQWDRVVEVYKGSLLEGYRSSNIPEFESWLEYERQSLFNSYREAVLKVAEALQEDKRFQQAADILAHLHTFDTFDEEVFRHYLELLGLAGKRRDALKRYEQFKKTLRTEFDAMPEQLTQTLIEKVRSGDLPAETNATVPDEKKAPDLRRILPTPATHFVGRDTDLGAVTKLLRDPACRLLTLVAPGGMGKTRLALELGKRLTSQFTDGAFFAPFIAVNEPELMVAALADALEFTFVGQQDPKAQLLEYLSTKNMLLIMDNLEHLLEGADLVVEVLSSAPKLKILATSREHLNIHAEWLYDLKGMRTKMNSENITTADALDLFAQSAKQVDANFSLIEENKNLVTEICERVGGMPLAIELAASWLRVLSLEEIASELEKGFDILETTTKDLPERHQSVRVVFALSWQQLGEGEQAALKKLSIFQGGFSKEAAQTVAGVSLPLLLLLRNKSFLEQNSSGRFEQHPLLQQFAASKLQEISDEETETKQKHAAYYTKLVSDWQEAAKGPNHKEVTDTLETDLPNLFTAWKWALETHDYNGLVTLASGLESYYKFRGLQRVCIDLLAKAIPSLEQAGQNAHFALGNVLLRLAYPYMRTSQLDKSLAAIDRSDGLLASTDDPELKISSLVLRSVLFQEMGRGDEALTYAKELLALQRKLDDKQGEADSLNGLAVRLAGVGKIEEAETYLHKSLALNRELENELGIGGNLISVGLSYMRQDRLPEARQALDEALTIAQKTGFQKLLVDSLRYSAKFELLTGDYGAAQKHFEQALETSVAQSDISHRIGIEYGLARVETARGNATSAMKQLTATLAKAAEAKRTYLQLDGLVYIAELYIQQEKFKDAASLLGHVLEHPRTVNGTRRLAKRLSLEAKANLPASEWEEGLERGKKLGLEQLISNILN